MHQTEELLGRNRLCCVLNRWQLEKAQKAVERKWTMYRVNFQTAELFSSKTPKPLAPSFKVDHKSNVAASISACLLTSYPYAHGAAYLFTPHQRSFLWGRWRSMQTHNWSKCREVAMETSALKLYLYHPSSSRGSGIITGGGWKIVGDGGGGDCCEVLLSRQGCCPCGSQ